MAFQLMSASFGSDEQCILYAGSHLTGHALGWFENLMAYDPRQAALTNWEEFSRAFQASFGEPNLHFSAQHRLYHLKMQHDGHIMDFNAEFMRDSAPSQLDPTTLAMLYYMGLPTRLQNEITCVGRPLYINQLLDLVVRLDRTFWEQREQAQARSKTQQTNRSQTSTQTQQSGTSSTTGSTPKPTTTDEEKAQTREYRMRNGLCLCCGTKGHLQADCPNGQWKPRTTARAATTTTPAEAASKAMPDQNQAPAASIVEVPDSPKNT